MKRSLNGCTILKTNCICGTDAALLRLFLQFCILRKVVRFAAMAKIFLLEDDKILSKGISIALKKDEHMVTAVYGYLEALQEYQKQKYDFFCLILTCLTAMVWNFVR